MARSPTQGGWGRMGDFGKRPTRSRPIAHTNRKLESSHVECVIFCVYRCDLAYLIIGLRNIFYDALFTPNRATLPLPFRIW